MADGDRAGTRPVELEPVLKAVDAGLDAALARLFDFLRIPSISTDPAHAGACQDAAQWVAGELEALGFSATVHPTAGHPVVVARTDTGAPRRVLFYGHYDVQPVDPLDLWETPPFEPRLGTTPDGRRTIVGRGACDDKGQVLTFLEALRAFRATRGALPVDVTVLLEGEEECGSPNLPGFLAAHASALSADLALVCDTGMWDQRTPSITSSLRGILHTELTIEGADRDLHSGLFGGAARNPIHVLATILADAHDGEGRVTLPGFYDDVREPPAEVRARWQALGLTAEAFLKPVGLSVSAGERDRLVIEQIQSRPTFEVNGIFGGYTGAGTKTIIPARATAKISFRLVADQDPAKLRAGFETFVAARVPADCRAVFHWGEGARAFLVPPESPDLGHAAGALAAEWGVAPVTIGSGGSIPVVGQFKDRLGVDTLLIGFALDDDRVHSPNEKYDLTSFHKGTRSWVRILDALAQR
ncbi:M20/M25/M40 family metallo-hydrolase [Xanthobacter flavus]|uniref:M20/M25/M40 family metallo-hydrolase n=1 Tax=Xanthobacter flavus TaxID=281 RepID=UPI001AE87592|nr:M20/M25/M40 family metallo-hydrolase [Xanthobacter flavus]MBP2148278.1 acetylornithine deacetylase/succinyl-diaminopimelate desuccinylase-like protein [Xanthobacter flavus]